MAKSTGFQVDGPVDTHLNRSKFISVSRQIPAIYVSLIFNTAIVAWSFAGAAPPFLSTWFPLALCLACLGRLIFWWRGLGVELDDAMIARRLRGTTLLAGVLGIAFMTWASSLFPFGDPYRQSQLAFYMCVTVLGCCLCLTHLPITTLLLFATVVIPSTVFYATTGIAAFVCIAANMLTVSAAMGMVGYRHYRDFIDLVNTQRDLTERQAETQRLSDENSRLANIDALTGLPNRRSFFAELDALLDASRPREGRLALGVVDLDGFKPVNDVYGHAVGDELLCLVAARLRALCPDDVIFARLGGDEFGLILREPRDDDGLRTLGGLLTSALQDPFDLPRVRVRIAGSIGFATWPEAAATGQLLYERADYALYHAKENNRGAVVLYSREHERKIREASRVVQHLRSCDLERELSVACQPIIDTDAGRTIGFEALARWTSPDLGEVAPEVFIRLAERNNMVNELTCVLLRKALRAARDWPEHLRVSFNLSTFDMASPEAMQRIIGILKSSDFPTSRIDFEITETSVFVDFTQARKSIEALKALGARISLDDFGCGYSSLAYVQQLPLDRIKIDRGFVANIETDRASRNIVKTIVDLCRNLDLACVVEGVETPSQLRALRELGCHLVQGYLYSRPMPVDNIPVWLLAETRASMEMADSADGAISPLRKTM